MRDLRARRVDNGHRKRGAGTRFGHARWSAPRRPTDQPFEVGEVAGLSGDVVLTAEGQVPSTVIAAVIGREAPVAAVAGTPGATPVPVSVGSVQVTAYACPPLVEPDQASPGRCLRDPEAVALELAMDDGAALRDVGPSTERQGLPTWVGLAGGDYVLRATGFKEGFDRFFVRGLDGIGGR